MCNNFYSTREFFETRLEDGVTHLEDGVKDRETKSVNNSPLGRVRVKHL